MTLSDLAILITTELNQQETEDLAACKSFLKRGFAVIWQSELWKDSLVEYQFTVPSTDYVVTDEWLPTKKILLVVPDILQVCAVRTGTFKLNVESSELFYRADWDEFSSTGRAEKFRLLSPAVWELDTATTLYRRVMDAADASATILIDAYLPATNSRERVSGTSLGSVDRIDAFTKAVTTASVEIGEAFTFTNNSGASMGVNVNTVPAVDVPFDNIVADGASVTLDVNEGDTINMSTQTTGGGSLYSETVGTAAAGNTVTSPFGVLSFAADLTRTFVASDSIITLSATDTAASKRQRIQFLGAITAGTVLRVLGKAKAPTFTADTDEPGLTGCEDCLMAYAMAPMLRRSRQYAKAQDAQARYLALLQQLKAEQTVQQAHSKRFIPEDGYGDNFGFSSMVFNDAKDW